MPLPALVILKVYGEELAKVVLKNRIAESEDPEVKQAYRKAVEALGQVKKWLPDSLAHAPRKP